MASSGNFQNVFQTGYALRVEWAINSQDIAANTSNITVTAYLVSLGSSYIINSSHSKTVNLLINGTTYTGTISSGSLTGNQKRKLLAKTVNITHGVDGTKSIDLRASIGLKATLSGTYFNTVYAPASGNQTVTLDAIARVTNPTTSGTLNVGSSITINTPRAAGTFTHTLQYSLNNSSWTNIATNVGTSTTWTLPAALATAKTGATSGTVYIRCITYNGGTNLGNKTITRTYYITAAYASPSVALSVSQTNNANISSYIRGRSSVTLKATATLKHGANAAKYVFNYGGVSKTVTSTSATASVTFTLPSNAAASYAYSVTLTDSRGYTASKSGTVTTIAYSPPVITSINAVRGDYDGTTFTENTKGNSLKIDAIGSITSLSNANAKNYKIEYRLSHVTTYTTLIDTKAASAYAVAVTEYTSAIFSENASYVIRFTLSDDFDSISMIFDVPSQKVLLNFSANGKAMAIGGIASEDDALEIMMELYATGGIKPMQLANGTSFDEIIKPGVYIGNAASGNFVNPPVTSGTFVLDVSSAGTAGQVMQRYSYVHKSQYRAYVRFLYENTWGEWQPTEGFTAYATTGFAGQVRLSNGLMMQWGRVAIAVAANVTSTVAIKYPITFYHAPIVHVIAHTGAPELVNVSCDVGTTSGTNIYLRRSSAVSTWVSWFAIGRG